MIGLLSLKTEADTNSGDCSILLSLSLVTVVPFENWYYLITGIEEVPTRFTSAVF